MIKNKKTILIVDDTESNLDILLELLGDDYDLIVSLDGKSALKIAQEEYVDLIMLDIMMPQMDGYEVCKRLKQMKNTKDIPVIFITAKNDEDSIEKAYSVGGVDYIPKPFKPKELLARLKMQLKLTGLIKHLEFIASYDELTKIYNRRLFFQLALDRFERSKSNLYAVLIDIYKLKNINDIYGHEMGNQLIKLVVNSINRNIKDDTIFARISGKEFAMICTSDSELTIVKDLHVIRANIEKLEIIAENGKKIRTTINIGIAKADESINNLDDLLKEARDKLFELKTLPSKNLTFR